MQKTMGNKSLRLNRNQRDLIISQFLMAYTIRMKAEKHELTLALSEDIFKDIYTEEQRIAIQTLGGYVTTQDIDSLCEYTFGDRENNHRKESVRLTGFPFLLRHSYSGYIVNKTKAEYLDRAYEINRRYIEEREALDKATSELVSVVNKAKTRKELERLWSPVRDLMGDAWTDATTETIPEKSNLPVSSLATLNTLYDKIKPITTPAEQVAQAA